jgi:hypothetical protein
MDPQDYVGLDAETATRKAEAAGWQHVRAYPRGSLLTLDFREGRLDLELDDEGIVIRAWVG